MIVSDELSRQIGRNLYVFRKISGLSYGQVAEALGVQIDTVRQWERSSTAPRTADLFRRAASLYGVKVADIMELRCKDGSDDFFPDMLEKGEWLKK